MAKFNPNMSKQDLVSAFSSKAPFLNSMSTDGAYNYIVKQYPQYKLDTEDTEYKPATRQDTNLWDSMPNFIKDGYNKSLQGMAYQMSTGDKRFDLAGYEPGIVGDLGAGIASFFAPVDFATTVFGGGVGGVLAKTAGKETVKKYVFKKLVQNGANRKVAAKSANKAVEYTTKAGAGAGALGLYSGASEALQQGITDGTIDVGKVVKAGAKGAVLGGMTGATNAYLTQAGAGLLARTAAEIGEVGIGTSVLEGRAPTPQDFLYAGGMVVGMKGVGVVASKGYGEIKRFADEARKPEFRYEAIPKGAQGRKEIYRASSELTASQRLATENLQKEWGRGNKQKGTIVTEGKDTIQFKSTDGTTKSYKRKWFFDNFSPVDRTNMSPKQRSVSLNSDIRKLENRLKHKKKVKQTNRAKLIEKTDEKKPINLNSLSNESKNKHYNNLRLELYAKQALDNLEKNGIRVVKPRVSMFMDKLLPEKVNKLFDIVRPAKNQGTVDPVRRAYIGLADEYLTSYRRLTAESHDLMQKAGFLNDKPTRTQVSALATKLGVSKSEASKNYWTLLSDAVENNVEIQEVVDYKGITNYLFNTAKQSGVDASGYFERYIPRILKEEVAEAIFSDISNLANIAFKGAKESKDRVVRDRMTTYQQVVDMILEAKNNPNAWASKHKSEATFLNRIAKSSMAKFESENTRRGMLSIIEEGGTLPYFNAISQLARETSGQLFRIDGNIERKRKLKLPNDFYERNSKKLLGIYSMNLSRRIAEVKHFGKRGEVSGALFRNASRGDEEIMKELHRHILGDIAYARDYNFNPSVKNFLNKAMEFETATKIGLGTASAMNLSQFTISSALSAGYWRFARGAYNYVTDKKFREQVKASGADLYKYIDELTEISPKDSLSRKLVHKITDISQFNRINSYNNILAASTARVFVDDLVAVVSGKRNIFNPGQLGSKKWAKATLLKMGIDPKEIRNGKVSESSMLNALSKFAIDTQLQKNILSDPLVLNRPTWKPFLQFKSFGYRQYNFIKDTLTHDAVNYNVLPMLRLAGAGFATGAIGLKAKEYMKYLVSGEQPYDPSEFLASDGKEIIENIAAVGAFGFLGDFMSAALEEGRTYSQALKFLATPAFMSDIDMFLNSFIPALERDYQNYQGDFIKRVPARVLKLTGSPLLKDLAKRKDIGIGQTTLIDVPIETKGMRKDRLTFLRGRKKSAMLDKLIKAESKEAYAEVIQDVRNFNIAYPNYKINITDINNKAVMKRKMQKWKKRKEI
jgi:hypothetical protein